VLRAVRGWRRVTALVRASVHVYGSWCPRVERMRSFRCDAELDVRCIGVAKNFSRFELDARLRRSFSYRLITLIFARLVLPPPSHLRLLSLMVRVRRLGSSRTKSDRQMGIHGA